MFVKALNLNERNIQIKSILKTEGDVSMASLLLMNNDIRINRALEVSGNIHLTGIGTLHPMWGRISGNIHEQTDLMEQFELKVDKSSYLTNLEIEEIFRRHN